MNEIELMAHLLEEDRARTKLAFSTNAFSGPMNPNIRSGASDLPPFTVPSLQAPLRKKVAFILDLEDEFDELQKIAATSAGLWWEQVGGPFLAKGGDHKTFEKMMADADLPPGIQEKFKRVAKEKYAKGSQWAPGGAPHSSGESGESRYNDDYFRQKYGRPPSKFQVLKDIAPLAAGISAMAGVAGYAALNKNRESEAQAPSELRGRIGSHLSITPTTALIGGMIGGLIPAIDGRDPMKGSIIGTAIGGALGTAFSELNFHGSKKVIENKVRSKLRLLSKAPAEKREKQLDKLELEASKTTKEDVQKHIGGQALNMGLGLSLGLMFGHRDAMTLAGKVGISGATTVQGNALINQYEARAVHQKVQQGLKEFKKAAASAPTRGNFMMASDIPPLKVPTLRTGIEKGSEMLPDYVTYGSGDFKPVRLNEKKAAMSPFAAAAQAKTVGAPRVTAPPGPSIAEIAKPRGAGFGSGMAGALKNSTSGSGPVDLKATSPGGIK